MPGSEQHLHLIWDQMVGCLRCSTGYTEHKDEGAEKSSSFLLKLLMEIEIQRGWPVHRTGALKVWVCPAQSLLFLMVLIFAQPQRKAKRPPELFLTEDVASSLQICQIWCLFHFPLSACSRCEVRCFTKKTLHPVPLNVPTPFSVFVGYETTSPVSALVPSFVAV